MASRKTLNAKNLAALGADRLAGLLLEVTKGNAAGKRRMRLELAGEESSAEMAREVRKPLATIDRAQGFVYWQGRGALLADLETQRRAIVDRIGPADPSTGFDLIWRFLSLTNGIYERCDDSNGRVQDFFHKTGADLLALARAAKPQLEDMADRLANRLPHDEWGHFSDLISGLAPLLGASGLDRLKFLISEAADSGKGGYALRHALEEIADLEGDVDAFIAQKGEAGRRVPAIAADIASRLLEAGRVGEALAAIEAVEERRHGWIPFEWEDTRARVLEASGREDDARAFRWDCYARSLSADHLRTWLKPLPDFEDIEAEERALDHALDYGDVHVALHFLASWPALDRAAQLVLERRAEIDGNHYELLGPAADLLEAKHPLAATLLRRAMIDFALGMVRVKRFRHIARHLRECATLAGQIKDFGHAPDHEAYVAELRGAHGRKSSFWAEVGTVS